VARMSMRFWLSWPSRFPRTARPVALPTRLRHGVIVLEDPVSWRQLVREYGELRQLKAGMTPQARGQRFNSLIAELLKVFGIAAQANQYGMGEVDVTFVHGGQRFILEAKWEQTKTGTGPIAKLQRRLEQRMAGVHGVFLAMKGYSPAALDEINRGRRPDVLLLDQAHWEAMLSGAMPPQELIDQVANAASFRGRAYTPLPDLLKKTVPAPEVTFGAANEIGDHPLDDLDGTSAGARALVVLSDIESPQVGITLANDQKILITVAEGVLAVDLAKQRSEWAAPIAGCCDRPLVLPDGSLALARSHGVLRYRNGDLTALSSGSAAPHASHLLLHPDGSVWCLDPGSPNGSSAILIKAGAALGDEQWREVPYPPGRATAADWLATSKVILAGNPDLLVLSDKRPEQWISLPDGYPAGLVAISERRVITAAGDFTLRLTDVHSQQHVVLGRLRGLDSPTCSLARSPSGIVVFAGRYLKRDGQTRLAIISVQLPDQQRTSPPTRIVPRSPAIQAGESATVLSAPKAAPTPSAGPSGSGDTATAPVIPRQSDLPAPVSPSSPVSTAQTMAEERAAEQQRGYLDGLKVAGTLPLYALEGLVAANFNVVRWLESWRDGWRMIATGQAPTGAPLTDWLPPLARYLGSHAAPAEVMDAHFTPIPAYMVGFSDGMKATWESAVHERLVPSDTRVLSQWLSQPDPGHPTLRLRTIDELRAAAVHARKVATWKIVGRVTLWVIVVVFGICELGAIGVTVTNGWPQHTVGNAVIGNLCYAIPFAALLGFALFDLRRKRRRRRLGKPAGQAEQSQPSKSEREAENPPNRAPRPGTFEDGATGGERRSDARPPGQ
jgi:Restriction endonuclease